jgi:hypothetical protein
MRWWTLALFACGIADQPEPDIGPDLDADGVPAPLDCDDADPDKAHGFPERCDGVDQDCDGLVDEDFDLDRDGVPACDPLLRAPWAKIPMNGPFEPYGRDLRAVDLDGDGVDELLALEWHDDESQVQAWLLRGDRTCPLCDHVPFGDPSTSYTAIRPLGDLDGDGHREVGLESLDLPAHAQIWRLHPGTSLWFESPPQEAWLHLAPFREADGTETALFHAAQYQSWSTLVRITADPQGAPLLTAVAAADAWEPAALWIVGVDLDVDGAPELGRFSAWCQNANVHVQFTTWPQEVPWWSQGCFTFDAVWSPIGDQDVDGDTHPDALWAGNTNALVGSRTHIGVLLATGPGRPPAHQRVPAPSEGAAIQFDVLRSSPPALVTLTARSNGDGFDYLLSLWRVRADAEPAQLQALRLPSGDTHHYPSFAAGDFNGDGWQDLAVSHIAEGASGSTAELLLFAARRDCDDHDPTIQRGCPEP